jgi:hypothetical protein
MHDNLKKLGWFALIWVLSVTALGAVAALLRWMMSHS